MSRTKRLPLRIAGAVLALLIAETLGCVAARETLTSSQQVEETPARYVVSTVSEQTVGKTMNFAATAQTRTVPVFYNVLAGTLTSLSESGDFVEGQVLYTVDDLPVRAIKSDLVFYRDLASGARGKDVAVVQGALKRLGYLAADSDGRWGPSTTSAVKAWQRDLGASETGIIQFGEIVAVDELPAKLTLSDTLALARPVTVGEATVSAPAGERSFYLALNPDQARLIPVDATIEIFGDSTTWPAIISSVEEADDNTTRLILTHPSGGPPCQDACGEIAGTTSASLRSIQHIIPKVTGPAVPTIAVRTNELGETYVVLESGAITPVEVLGSGNGFTIVTGVDVGTQVIALEVGAVSPAPAEVPVTEDEQ